MNSGHVSVFTERQTALLTVGQCWREEPQRTGAPQTRATGTLMSLGTPSSSTTWVQASPHPPSVWPPLVFHIRAKKQSSPEDGTFPLSD